MAAGVLERFSQLVHEAVSHWDGRVVKQIGDAFMSVFAETRSAVACAVEIELRTAREAQFPAVRSGMHCGHVLYREGDYLGTSVNVAAEAERHQVLVTGAVRVEAKGVAQVEFLPVGKRRPRRGRGSAGSSRARSPPAPSPSAGSGRSSIPTSMTRPESPARSSRLCSAPPRASWFVFTRGNIQRAKTGLWDRRLPVTHGIPVGPQAPAFRQDTAAAPP